MEAEAETEAGAEAEAEVEEVEVEAEAEAEVEAEVEAEAEAEAGAEAEAEAEAETEAEAGAKAGAEAEPVGDTNDQGGGEGSRGDGDDGGAAPPSLPATAFAGYDVHRGELPFRRLHAEGVVRPRARRAWWGYGPGLGSGGGGAPLMPAGGRSARQLAAGGRSARALDLPDRFSVGHIVDSEHEWRAHDRACEPQLGLERERGQGGADEAGAGPGQRARALWMGLCEAAVDRLEAGGLELARLVTGGRAGARHAAVPEQVQQEELEHDEAQAEQVDEWQQQQQQRGGDGGVEEQEEQEQQSAGAVARRGTEDHDAPRGDCAPSWRDLLAVSPINRLALCARARPQISLYCRSRAFWYSQQVP